MKSNWSMLFDENDELSMGSAICRFLTLSPMLKVALDGQASWDV